MRWLRRRAIVGHIVVGFEVWRPGRVCLVLSKLSEVWRRRFGNVRLGRYTLSAEGIKVAIHL